jgi:hypothetical protein
VAENVGIDGGDKPFSCAVAGASRLEPIDREGLAELDESASSRYWHDPDRKPGLNRRAKMTLPEPGNKEDVMPHFMIRWQFTSTSAKALVGKPHDRTGAAKALVEGFGGKLDSYYLALAAR